VRWRRITDGAELGPYKEVKFTQEDQAGGRLPWRSLLLTEKAERAERRDQFSGRMLRNRLWLRLLLEECKDGGLKVKRRTKRKETRMRTGSQAVANWPNRWEESLLADYLRGRWTGSKGVRIMREMWCWRAANIDSRAAIASHCGGRVPSNAEAEIARVLRFSMADHWVGRVPTTPV